MRRTTSQPGGVKETMRATAQGIEARAIHANLPRAPRQLRFSRRDDVARIAWTCRHACPRRRLACP
jgi:hypothetical protein